MKDSKGSAMVYIMALALVSARFLCWGWCP